MSEKTVADKLFLKNAASLAIINGAAHPAVVAQMPLPIQVKGEDGSAADVVLMFALDKGELARLLPLARQRLGEKGALWIAYLKGTASRATDINRDTINAYASERGLNGVAIISIDSDWSALRVKRV
jgi:Protein of unknown function (DUF3052)